MNKQLIVAVAAVALCFAFTTDQAEARHRGGFHFNTGGIHVEVGNPHRGFHQVGHRDSRDRDSHHRGHHAIDRGFGRGNGGGHHYGWHNTSHYDWHPGSIQWHGNHFDYIPGHWDYHKTGHWDRH